MPIPIKKYFPIFSMVLFSFGLAMAVPVSNHNYYIIGLLTSSCLCIVYVVSWDLLSGYTGMLNFGQMLFAGVAAYTAALLELNFNTPRVLIILASVAAGTGSSLLLGLPALRVRSTYFALVSFVLPLVFHRVTMTFIEIFGGDYGLSVPRIFSREGLYYSSILIMLVAVVTLWLLVRSRVGMAFKSIREDEETARAVGINIQLFKLIACLISAFFTSLAGVCSFYYMGHVGPEIFGMMGSFDVVIMGVIGGPGTIFGPALGGFILPILLEGMRPIGEYRNIIYAGVLVAVVMFMPGGFWGGVSALTKTGKIKKVIVEDSTS